jgi:exopolysaccharide biosynthesis WecB/TagA/CpsF family protein
MKTALVLGAGGFIGSHLVTRLKGEGFWVRGVDLKYPDFSPTAADDFVIGDLRDQAVCRAVIDRRFDEVYQLAADMGGAGYIFTGEHDADVMHNSATINLNVVDRCRRMGIGNVFYSSSACIYPAHNQEDPDNPNCAEDSAYPANPDSEYGWEKLFSERLYFSYARNYGMNCRVARFHNIFGPEGTWTGGKEKAPAAICRKVAEAADGGSIEIWGDGLQTRSFLYIDECLDGVLRLMRSATFAGPVNIGSEEMVTINQLAEMAAAISGKTITLKHVPGPLGVRGRRSDNRLISEKLGWAPSQRLVDGLTKTYAWVAEQVEKRDSTDGGSDAPIAVKWPAAHETFALAGVNLSSLDRPTATTTFFDLAQGHAGGFITVTGAHGIVAAQTDAKLRDIINHGRLALPDGMPAVWVGRLKGHTVSRVAGSDFVRDVLGDARARRLRHYFYGGDPQSAKRIVEKAGQVLGPAAIAGWYTPPFREVGAIEDGVVIEQIAAARPDVIWVNLSTPKQEYWMANHARHFPQTILVGIGAALGTFAGLQSRAPVWMRSAGLEWLYRFGQEPRRLWPRYRQVVPAMLRIMIAEAMHRERHLAKG